MQTLPLAGLGQNKQEEPLKLGGNGGDGKADEQSTQYMSEGLSGTTSMRGNSEIHG